jgi:hypothetical protein
MNHSTKRKKQNTKAGDILRAVIIRGCENGTYSDKNKRHNS